MINFKVSSEFRQIKNLKKNRFSDIISNGAKMEEKVREVEMVFIQNTSGNDYTVECVGRNKQSVKLNCPNVEGIEINANMSAMQIKSSFLQMSENQSKMWNLRFAFPTNLRIKFLDKILIETD